MVNNSITSSEIRSLSHWTHPSTPIYLGYARASGKEQDLKSQEKYLIKRAGELSMPFKIWSEKKTSKDYNRLIVDIIRVIRPGDIVGLWMTDRIARPDPGDEYIVFGWAQQIQQSGGKLEMGGVEFNTTNPADFVNLYFKLRAAGDAWDIILKNTARGRDLARETSNFIGGGNLLPLGYRRILGQRDRPDGKGTKTGFLVEVDPDYAQIVREIFEWSSHGKSLYSLAKAFDDRGIKPVKAEKWNRATLFRILHNPIYMGRILANPKLDKFQTIKSTSIGDSSGMVTTKHYPILVTEGEWWDGIKGYRECGTTIRGVRTYHPSRSNSLYAGTTRCWYCWNRGHKEGTTLVPTFAGASSLQYRLPHRVKGCISYRGIDETIYEYLFSISTVFVFSPILETEKYLEAELTRLRSGNQDQVYAELQRDYASLKNKRDGWHSLILESSLDDLALVKKYRDNIAQLNDQMESLAEKLRVINLGTQIAEMENLKFSFAEKTLRDLNSHDPNTRKVARKAVLSQSWIFPRSINFMFRNTKIVWFRLPLKTKGPTPIKHHFYELGVSFNGQKQMTGWVDFEKGQWHVEVSKLVPGHLHEAMEVEVVPDWETQFKGLTRV